MMSYTRPWVKDSTLEVYTSPAMFLVWVFLAKITGQWKYWATTQAIPMPEASMVRILLISQPANRRLNSLPISANSSTSIWWFKKLSTFSTSVPFTFPSLRIRSFKSSIGPPPPFLFSYVAARSGERPEKNGVARSERATVDGDTVLFYKIFSRSAIPFSRSYGNFFAAGRPGPLFLLFSCRRPLHL